MLMSELSKFHILVHVFSYIYLNYFIIVEYTIDIYLSMVYSTMDLYINHIILKANVINVNP